MFLVGRDYLPLESTAAIEQPTVAKRKQLEHHSRTVEVPLPCQRFVRVPNGTLWQTDIAIENCLLTVDLPIKDCDFPKLC